MKRFWKYAVAVAAMASLCAAGTASADTITVETLTFDGIVGSGPSAGLAEWTYSVNLSAFGQADATDGFNIAGIGGLVGLVQGNPLTSPPLPVAIDTGVAGSLWQVLGTPSSPLGAPDGSLVASYLGNIGNIPGSASPLVTVSFFDVFATLSPHPAVWGSQDHAIDTGLPEAPVTGQAISTPGSPSGFQTPLPASSVAGSALLGLVFLPKLFKKARPI